jgi:hypothetical protein
LGIKSMAFGDTFWRLSAVLRHGRQIRPENAMIDVPFS